MHTHTKSSNDAYKVVLMYISVIKTFATHTHTHTHTKDVANDLGYLGES